MTLAGRYRFDSPSREPMGSRLLRAGLKRGQVQTVLIAGGEKFPLFDLWPKPGAVTLNSPLGELPYQAFISSVVFGTKSASELFDYFVNVGPLTPVSGS